MTSSDPFNLERFVAAQGPVLNTVLAELAAGRKQSHWMWFIFPQLRGLGHSSMAQFYGIASLDEGRAYLAHPLLGSRLTLCTEAMLEIEGRSLNDILGSPDDMKFCSSMTLFSIVADSDACPFRRALNRFCGGRIDDRTSAILKAATEP
jgi:uncharacterized protein (DUF1810 family)